MEPTVSGTDPWIGQVVDGRYRVLERVGAGGMGTVYKVSHVRIGKVAALKALHPSLVADRQMIRRFHQEAEAISRLNHPNIVQVFDFGRARGTVYLVMEYLRGEDLGAILRRDGAVSLRRFVSILAQVCDALTEAHEAGIVHRDLKPANVRVARTRDGLDFVKVMDFGLAKVTQGEGASEITDRGHLVGTPYYMSPEQIRGLDVDHRADIYGLGAMAYRMITGQQCFEAPTPVAVLTRHVSEAPRPPSAVRPGLPEAARLDAIILRALAKDRAHRYGSAHELKRDLLALAEAVETASSEPRRRADRAPERREADAPAPARPARVSAGASERLSREDLAFERKLRRARWIRSGVLAALVLGAAGAAAFVALRRPAILAPGEEAEPNDTPDRATPLVEGKPVRGRIGKRLSERESDRDWYRFDVAGERPRLLRARVSGIPNMDIVLELYGARGERLARADVSGRGGPEILPDWPVRPGTHYLLVRELWREGVRPTENVTDTYAVEATTRAADPGWEKEPNDTVAQCQGVEIGVPLRAYLGARADVDCYEVSGDAGKLGAKVSGVPGVDIALEVLRPGRKPLRFDRGGPGAGESFAGIRLQKGEAVRVRVVRKPEPKPRKGGAPPGLETPYTLRLTRRL